MKRYVEWPTLALITGCTFLIPWVYLVGSNLPIWLAVSILAVLLALHSSVQHEVLHGHPFRQRWLNEMLVCVPFGVFIPYLRFRDLHLIHHQDERLTDPYDDPESNYMDPQVWHRISPWLKIILTFNNTLIGRVLIGPVVGLWCFYKADIAAMLRGEMDVFQAYLLHMITLVCWLWFLYEYSSLPWWVTIVVGYAALSLLRVRTFLEHQAHVDEKGRTVVVEDRGFFAFLFLNNNFHLVHHTYPKAPWYRLPALYRANRREYLDRNHHYVFANYGSVFKQFLFKCKDPVPLPIVNGRSSDFDFVEPTQTLPLKDFANVLGCNDTTDGTRGTRGTRGTHGTHGTDGTDTSQA